MTANCGHLLIESFTAALFEAIRAGLSDATLDLQLAFRRFTARLRFMPLGRAVVLQLGPLGLEPRTKGL